MPDRVELHGLEVFARHGVLPEEHESGQTFLVDIALEFDLAAAGASDDLGDTVDYGELARSVHEVVSRERWDLIERVATRVAEVALDAHPRIDAVEVTVHKPDAPIGPAFRDVLVHIRRTRR